MSIIDLNVRAVAFHVCKHLSLNPIPIMEFQIKIIIPLASKLSGLKAIQAKEQTNSSLTIS